MIKPNQSASAANIKINQKMIILALRQN